MINSTFTKPRRPMKRSGRLRPIRKTRLGSDARLKQDLTKLLSRYVRQRDPVCIVCERRPSTDCSHLWHRDMPPTEFNPRNVWGCCHPCNMAHETKPQPMHDAVLMRIGERAYADLAELAHSNLKLTRTELEILVSELKEKVS